MAEAPPKKKLKREHHPLQFKYDAILEVEKGVKTKSQIAEELGIKHNTLSTWLKKADTYKKAYETQQFGPDNKRMIPGKFPGVKTGLKMFFTNARASHNTVSGPILQDEAMEIAKGLGITDFKASQGWLTRLTTA